MRLEGRLSVKGQIRSLGYGEVGENRDGFFVVKKAPNLILNYYYKLEWCLNQYLGLI